jgi:Uma2 family endonuclease
MTAYTRVEVAEQMTAEEFFCDAPEDRKAELIDGVMIMPSPAHDTHEALFHFLFRLLGDYVEENTLGTIRGSRTAVELDVDQAPEPDILFVARERRNIIRPKGIVGAPDLVIEILSASTARNDRGPKFRAYQRAGVRELWLIDPYGPAGTEFFQLQNGRFVPTAPDDNGRIHSIAVHGFWIDVQWLWPSEEFVPVRRALAQIAEPAKR